VSQIRRSGEVLDPAGGSCSHSRNITNANLSFRPSGSGSRVSYISKIWNENRVVLVLRESRMYSAFSTS
jgi:hypothetical protein